MARKKRPLETVSAGSTADIAFLLLIFFLVTTTIVTDQGLAVRLPLKVDEPPVPQHERNLFTIVINRHDNLLVEGELRSDLIGLQEEIMTFVMNKGQDKLLSDSPSSAIVSLKTDRGTTYQRYISVYDEIKGAYYRLYGQKLSITPTQVREPENMPPHLRTRYEQLRKEIPMQISLAEPSDAAQ